MNIKKSDQNFSVWYETRERIFLRRDKNRQKLTSVSALYYNYVHKVFVKFGVAH